MKFAHVSDLHIGKILHGFSLIDDQQYILDQIVGKLEDNGIDVLVIAGDIYDKSVASVEGMGVFRRFLNDLVDRKIRVLLINGNHDSAERLTFGSEFMTGSGLYFSNVYDGNIKPVVLEDEYGPVNFYLLPFVKPAIVRHVFPEDEIDGYHSAVECVLRHLDVNDRERNVIVAHQNVTFQNMKSFSEKEDDFKYAGSEERTVGGLDAVGADLFSSFDYTALGHIHKNLKVGKSAYFCGAPLKYSIDERNDDKSMTVVTLGEKGSVTVDKIPLVPLRNIRQIEGSFDEITMMAARDADNDMVDGKDDYISIVLTDREMKADAMLIMRSFYPKTLEIRYRKNELRNSENTTVHDIRGISPMQIFEDFHKSLTNNQLSDEQRTYMNGLISEIWEEGV